MDEREREKYINTMKQEARRGTALKTSHSPAKVGTKKGHPVVIVK